MSRLSKNKVHLNFHIFPHLITESVVAYERGIFTKSLFTKKNLINGPSPYRNFIEHHLNAELLCRLPFRHRAICQDIVRIGKLHKVLNLGARSFLTEHFWPKQACLSTNIF